MKKLTKAQAKRFLSGKMTKAEMSKLERGMGAGFFGDLANAVKSVVSAPIKLADKAARFVQDKTGLKPSELLKTIGSVGSTVADIASYVPVIGAPVSGVAKQVSNYSNRAGDVVGAVGYGPVGASQWKRPEQRIRRGRGMTSQTARNSTRLVMHPTSSSTPMVSLF